MLPASTLLLIHILMSLVKFGWKGARQLIIVETHVRDFVQEAKFEWKGARQLVGVEIKPGELVQEAKFGRKRARQCVDGETQKRDFV